MPLVDKEIWRRVIRACGALSYEIASIFNRTGRLRRVTVVEPDAAGIAAIHPRPSVSADVVRFRKVRYDTSYLPLNVPRFRGATLTHQNGVLVII
jgi:hypothetical protein